MPHRTSEVLWMKNSRRTQWMIHPTLIRNSYTHESSTSSEQSSSRQPSQENTRPICSTTKIEPKLFVEEIWSSNKHYNKRVAAISAESTSEKCSSTSKTSTYQISTGQIVHERIYPAVKQDKLHLSVAVNGASKAMRGQLPLANLNLTNGDFGDDAGMVIENSDFCFVGLADGAGGNRSLGINPADFSRAILASCRQILRRSKVQSHQLASVILSAMHHVEASRIRGSSTLCLLALNKHDHMLTSLNIGDSGFIIYRQGEIIRRSKCTMNHDGCGPKQLFAVNGSFGLPCFITENELLRECSVDQFQVEKNDIIILSSDGLWDVIKAPQLHQIMERNRDQDLQDLADDLLHHAVNGYIINERDDILVIVCRVQ